MFKKNHHSYLESILAIVIGCLILYISNLNLYFIYIALVLCLIGIISPFIANLIDLIWSKVIWFIGLIIPNLLLAFIYYLILTPIASLSKIFGKKNMLHLKNNSDSLFINSNKNFTSKSFENPW